MNTKINLHHQCAALLQDIVTYEMQIELRRALFKGVTTNDAKQTIQSEIAEISDKIKMLRRAYKVAIEELII